ncbi:MAG: InlB B-repeat-containing protein [Lachnospiraceae bacterium]|nr:InlB B-repeat-containing protein [Lachnospiraceae bacterium]
MRKVKKLLTYLLTATMLFATVEPAYVYADENVQTVEEQTEKDAEDVITDETADVTADETVVEEGAGAEDEAPAEDEIPAETDTPKEADTPEEADTPAGDEIGADEEASGEDEAKEDAADDLLPDEEGSYTAVLDANGGTFPDSAAEYDYVLNQDKTTLTRTASYVFSVYLDEDKYPQRDGYELDGWSLTKGGEKACDEYLGQTIKAGSTTFYAVWKKVRTIKLDANGGLFPDEAPYRGKVSEDKKTLTITRDVEDHYSYYLSESYYPKQEGKALAGWSTQPGGKAEYEPYIDYEGNADITLYAVWIDAAILEFNAGTGVFPEKAADRGTLDANKKILTVSALPDNYFRLQDDEVPVKEGQAFLGWTTVKGGPVEYEADSSFRVEGNAKYYAVYTKNIKVTLHAAGGTFPDSIGREGELSADKKTFTTNIPSGSRFRIYSNNLPVYGNKALIGWASSKKAKEPDQGTEPTVDVRLYSNTDFYAVWEKVYTVTFTAAGNLYFRQYEDGKYVYIRTVKEQVSAGSRLSDCTPDVYEKVGDGYEEVSHLRWTDKKNAKVSQTFDDKSYCVTKNVKIYPIAADVTITWDGNGGSHNGENKVTSSHEYGEAMYITPEEFTREGYDLVGWGTKRGAKENGAVDFSNLYATKNKTYYAIWTKKTYKITIVGNGGIFTDAEDATISADGKTLVAYVEKGTSLSDLYFRYEKDGKEYRGPSGMVSTNKNGEPIAYVYNYVPKKDTTLYVVEPAGTSSDIPVIFEGNGGKFTNGQKRTLQYYAKGSVFYGPISSVTRDRIFVGWFTKKKGGKQLTEGVTRITKPMTVYAHWKKGANITFDANGGSFNTGSTYRTEIVQTVEKGTMLGSIYNGYYTIPTATWNNYGFMGWSKKKGGPVVDLAKIKATKNMRLYAVWNKGDNLGDGRIEMTGKTYFYTGKAIKPKFAVYDRAGKKVGKKNYKVVYSDNILAGTGYVTVIGKGKYSGMLRRAFVIKYNKTSKITKVRGNKKKLTLTCSKAKGAKGYAFYLVNRKTGNTYQVLSDKTSAVFKKVAPGPYLIYVHPVAYGSDGAYASESQKAGNVKIKQL